MENFFIFIYYDQALYLNFLFSNIIMLRIN